MATLDERFETAATKAENASEIGREWANGDATTTITTESGPLPSLAKFLADNSTQIDTNTSDIQEIRDREKILRDFDESATLIMDYANNRYEVYEQFDGKTLKTASQIETFSRGSSKTGYTPTGLAEAAADVPLNVIDPETGESLGRSIHEQRTNLLLWSEDFTNSAWTKQPVGNALAPIVTSNAGVAPDGTSTADRVQFDTVGATSSDRSLLRQLVNLSADAFGSIWLKSNTGSSQTIGLHDGSIIGDEIVTVTAEWQRFDSPQAAASVYFGLEAKGDLTTNQADILVWGAQLEQGTFSTPYIPTTTAQITRPADVCSIDNIDTSDWFNSEQGTFVVEFKYKGNPLAVLGGDNTSLKRLIYIAGTFIRYYDGDNIFNFANVKENQNKAAVSVSPSEVIASANGQAAVTGPHNGSFLDLFLLNIGNHGTSVFANTEIYSIKYKPAAVSDAELSQLSSL